MNFLNDFNSPEIHVKLNKKKDKLLDTLSYMVLGNNSDSRKMTGVVKSRDANMVDQKGSPWLQPSQRLVRVRCMEPYPWIVKRELLLLEHVTFRLQWSNLLKAPSSPSNAKTVNEAKNLSISKEYIVKELEVAPIDKELKEGELKTV